MQSSLLPSGWYYEYEYPYAVNNCPKDQVTAIARAIALNHCVYDSFSGEYVNVTCTDTTAYVRQYANADCTGFSVTNSYANNYCDPVFRRYYNCTSDANWEAAVPTNGGYALEQYYASEQACNDGTGVLYMDGSINGTCYPTYTTTSNYMLFPTLYQYTTTDQCQGAYKKLTASTTCTKATYAGTLAYQRMAYYNSQDDNNNDDVGPHGNDDNDDNKEVAQRFIITFVVVGVVLVVFVGLVGYYYRYYHKKSAKGDNNSSNAVLTDPLLETNNA